MDLSFQSTSLIGVLALCGYLTYLCTKTPNPDPTKVDANDRIGIATIILTPVHLLYLIICLNHIMIILLPSSRARFCRNPELLNDDLFSWSKRSGIFTAVMLVAAPLRLISYQQLGKNFTFRLEKPSNLVKTGMYAYVQHPSYTTLFLVAVANAFFWVRTDGISTCYLPSFVVQIYGLSEVVALAMTAFVAFGISLRIRDEEAMLKKEFGKEWIEYHSQTKRLLPWIF